MKEYPGKAIRNVALLGHLGSGKTSLTESLLFVTGALDKKGSVERKNTVADYSPEEQARQTTLVSSLIPVEFGGTKINVIDLPGSEEFIGEMDAALSVVSGAILVVDALSGVEAGTERCWDELRRRKIPTLILVNKMDKENVKFEKTLQEINELADGKAIPFFWPLGEGLSFEGFVNVVTGEGFKFKDQDLEACEIPADVKSHAESYLEQISEVVAETSEELLEKYFDAGLSQEDLAAGIKHGTSAGEVFPVIVGSGLKDLGMRALLNVVISSIPAPADEPAKAGSDASGAEVVRKCDDAEPFAGQVFKTVFDPFVGSLSFVRIYSGTIKAGDVLAIGTEKTQVKIPQVLAMCGKNQIQLPAGHAGDIVALTKVSELSNGATLCDKTAQLAFPPLELPHPTIYVAIVPKNQKDEEKISPALQKLALEDPTFELVWNPETGQQLIGGQGLTHINYILDKMKNMFKVEVDTTDPKIVYRETIRGKDSGHGRHKKQSGGAGQFGEVYIDFAPYQDEETGDTFKFSERVFGGAVPKNYFPAVEKGVKESLEHGPLAGFPVIGVHAELYDGSYHPVDSNEASFVMAAKLAWRDAIEKKGSAMRPTILEPIMRVEVLVHSDYLGSIMGDMTKRRGRILGTEEVHGGKTRLIAEVPESEIIKYTTELKAMTQASGRFTREFLRYQAVPEELIAKIIAEYKPKE